VELPLRALFEAPTVAGLAERVEALLAEGKGVQAPPLVPVVRDGSPLPLSFAQQRLWFIDQLAPGSAAYNMASALRLHGPLEVPVLRRSLDALVARHETLRTRFPQEDGRPRQLVEPAAPVPLCELDLRGVGAEEALRLIREAADRPFDLAAGPLLRATLVRMGEAEWVPVFVLHHIVSDGWSVGVLVREVTALYAAYARGEEPELPQLPVQYADYAAWQREWLSGETLEGQLAFWRERLRGAPPLLELPTDRPRTGATASREGVRTMELPAAELRALSRRSGVTLFMTLLAAWQALLGRYSGEEDVVVGTPVAGRTRVEVEGLIGFFVNMLVLRGDLSGDPTALELLARVREAALGAYAHQDVPFEKLVDELGVERSLTHTPLFQTIFVLQNTKRETLRLAEVEVEPVSTGGGVSSFDLNLTILEGPEQVGGVLQYRVDLFDAATAERMLVHYRLLLAGLAAHPERRLSEVELLDEDERRQLLQEWSAGAPPFPPACVHDLFAEQAARTPHAPAVTFEGESLTYAELERRASRLAGHLRRRGVGPETRVALCAERSADLVVGILGILRAGGAYIPVDPAYPAERVAYLLEDSGCAAVLVQDRLRSLVAPSSTAMLSLEQALADTSADEAVPEAGVRPENAAYVIYTSGSTGAHKGVMMSHRGLSRYLGWAAEASPLGDGAGAPLHSSLSFDLTVTSLFLPLLAGRAVAVLEEGAGAEPLARALREGPGFGMVKLTPSHLAVLAEQLGPEGIRSAARVWVLGGENLPAELAARLREWAPEALVVNEYGPTEAAVGCCVQWVEAVGADGGAVPIGRPTPDTRLYVLDRHLRPVARGAVGELYIGGAQLARGYQGRPELTAERFLPDPFGAARSGARMYRTGDRARWRADATLECLGRIDEQVKVRGFRIEPGEVEAALEAHPSVRAAAVVAQGGASGAAADLRLGGYVVAAEGEAVSPAALREHLGARLPEYMVPSALV
ncbi:MAG TPA: amino acid adenylation domain-containing protein, partial [Longimicrobiaceae bacterium]|nr:amino acid adenylation domain-containing protein [Longimicrobiaceae bacterium]